MTEIKDYESVLKKQRILLNSWVNVSMDYAHNPDNICKVFADPIIPFLPFSFEEIP